MKREIRFNASDFKPTKSARAGREFVPSEPGGRFSKFGFCNFLKKWVRRDNMFGINARFYNSDGEQTTVRLRLSEEGWNHFLQLAQENAWVNELKSREELINEGLEFEDSNED